VLHGHRHRPRGVWLPGARPLGVFNAGPRPRVRASRRGDRRRPVAVGVVRATASCGVAARRPGVITNGARGGRAIAVRWPPCVSAWPASCGAHCRRAS
jgi:hypothetical protein